MRSKFNAVVATTTAALLFACYTPAARADHATDAKAGALSYMQALIDHDKDKMASLFSGAANEKQLGEQLADMMVSVKALEAACTKRFGADAMKNKSNDMNPEKMKQEIEQSEVTVEGTTATLHKPGAKDGMQMVNEGGVWKVTSITGNPMGTKVTLSFLPPVQEVMKEVTQEVVDGKYATMDEVKKAGSDKMRARMNARMGTSTRPSTQPSH